MGHASASSDSQFSLDQNYLNKRAQKFDGFDFLRAVFAVSIVAYKTKLFYIPKIWFPSSLTTALSDYVLSGMVGALAVPVFLQISLFIFQLKSEDNGLGYFIKKRLPRLISLYLFWVVLITVFDILFVDGLSAVKSAVTSPKSFVLFIVSGNNTPYFFFFSLLFVTFIAEILVLIFIRLQKYSTRLAISYGLFIISSVLVFSFATIEPAIEYMNIQAPFLKGLNNLTGWDYSPLNFLPYIFSAAITVEEYKRGKLDRMGPFLKRKLAFLSLLTLTFFALEWVLTSHRLLIQVDQAPLDHYMRLSLVFGSWLLLYTALLMKQKPPELISFLAASSLGIYGFHVFFTFKKPLPLSSIPAIGSIFQTLPILQILTLFLITLIGAIALTLFCKQFKRLRDFV